MILYLFAQNKHLAPIGERGGEYVVVPAVGKFKAFAQLLDAVGEVAHGDIALFKCC